jgi:hypothetical protein
MGKGMTTGSTPGRFLFAFMAGTRSRCAMLYSTAPSGGLGDSWFLC